MATIAAAETALIKGGADLNSMDISEQWTGDCKNGKPGCAGGDSEDVTKWLIGRGGVLVKESDYPYKSYSDTCKDDLTFWNPGYKLKHYFYKHKCFDEGE